MPIYEYECQNCKKHHEVMQKIIEEPLSQCPVCGGALKRLISNTSFVLKGSGWYATDYASDKRKAEKTDDVSSKEEKTTEPKTEREKDKKSEAKSESKETVPTK